jgi:hypothetical protein
MKLTTQQQRVVRAALLFAVHGDDDAWSSLSPSEEDTAQDMLDELPEFGFGDDDDDDVTEDEEDYEDEED